MIRQIKRIFGSASGPSRCAVVLSGGGARSAYQAGVMRYIAEAFPESGFEVYCGISAGAINAAHLANHQGTICDATESLIESWRAIRPELVYVPESSMHFIKGLIRFTWKAAENFLGKDGKGHRRALVDTGPLREYLVDHLGAEEGRLVGITRNLQRGRLKAVAIVTTNYATGQTVSWVQGDQISNWERPNRVGINTMLTVDHVMASTSLPLIFPAVQIGDQWYGDGGIRLASPLSPVIHLGADRILVVSTRYSRTRHEADEPAVIGYPPAAQILGVLTNAIFLDALDQDAIMMQRINALLTDVPLRRRHHLRRIKLLMIRPSVDLGKMASGYELEMEGALGLVTGGLGSGESSSPDWLSMLLFDEDYIARLIEIGYEDAHRQHDRVEAFFSDEDVKPSASIARYLTGVDAG